MSLEQHIVDLTAAVKENSALLRELSVLLDKKIQHVGNDLPIGAATEKVIETAKKSTVAPVVEAPVSSPNGALPQSETPPAVPDEKTEPLDFQEDIVKPFGKLCVAKGREAGAAILAKWGVDKLSKIPADKYADLVADIINASV
jgi:hypothetical protein